ncbi:MAG TPA: hypothetical protein VGL77_12700 [Armatimonadota bacterium]
MIVDVFAPYRAPLVDAERNERSTRKGAVRCPVCNLEGTLREAKGMILCTHCFWAIELRQAS